MRRVNILTAVGVGLVAAVIGVALSLGVVHVWRDHLALHELALIEVQRQQQGGQK
jgi:hypothetical protein